jgi:alkylhydroperoxidase family enzyme
LGTEITQDVLADWRTAAVDERLRATLGLVEKMTLSPDDLAAADVAAVRSAGVSDDAIQDAVHVAFMFNLIDRLADAFAWDVQSREAFDKDASFLLKSGYNLIGPVRRRALAKR